MDLDRKLQEDSGEEYLRLYRNTAGEIEARDSERRRTWDEDRRRETAPDTGNEDTVFAEDSLYGESFVGKTADGTEVYETSKAVKAMPWKRRKQRFLEIMRDQYAGRTARLTRKNGQTYYARFDGDDVNKNIYGDKKSSAAGKDAKINVGADGNIFELVENASHKSASKEKGKTSKAHSGVTGWDYFVKTVQIDGVVYDLLANVRKKPDGEYVYSIQLNENKQKSASPVAFAYGSQKGAGYASEWGTTDEMSVSQNTPGRKGDRNFLSRKMRRRTICR